MASEDFRQTATVVPSPPLPADKVSLRRRARIARRDFVDSIAPDQRAGLEAALAGHLAPLVAQARAVGAYCPLPQEISPLPALVAAPTVAFPAFAAPHEPFRFLIGDPIESGPFAALQPSLSAPMVHPDLVLVPLVATDRFGTRLGQGKGHYDRVIGDLRRRGALLIGIGWALQLIDNRIPVDPWDVPLDGFASPEGVRMWR